MARNRGHNSWLPLAVIFAIFIGAPLVGTGNVLVLVALTALAVFGVIAWGPAQALSRRWEQPVLPTNNDSVERRIATLEALVQDLMQQQRHMKQLVEWQARLLDQGTPPSKGPPAKPPTRD
ncbi:MAG: hypothetical protein M1118_05020 [Chloroflexi bacterium]|nr:hypothetical protein [Chloroflexota bacterium]